MDTFRDGRRPCAPEASGLSSAAPWAFVLVGALLVGLVALNEGLLARLEVGR